MLRHIILTVVHNLLPKAIVVARASILLISTKSWHLIHVTSWGTPLSANNLENESANSVFMLNAKMLYEECQIQTGPITIIYNGGTYKIMVIVAGSAIIGTKVLSSKTEVYDSITRMWEVMGDVTGPEYSLNEYQTGVVSKNFPFCFGFLAPELYTTTVGRGVLVCDIVKKAWIQHDDEEEQLRWQQKCELPSLECCCWPASLNYLTQIFECERSTFVYWEQEHSCTTVHSCVAQLELSAILSDVRATPGPATKSPWSMVVHDDKTGSRGLLVYPEHVSVGLGANEVCIFNSVDLTTSMTYETGPRGGLDSSHLLCLDQRRPAGANSAREKDEMLGREEE